MAAWTGGREEADQATEAGLFKAAAAPLVKGAAQDLHAEGEVWAMPASVHPTLLTWIHAVLAAERQLSTNPLLTTSGIFIGSHEARAGTSVPATVVGSLLTLSAGFIARPIGGIIFGHYGDRVGRKKTLVMALILMGVSSTLIGLLPTYAMIGITAPILLTSLRFAQGYQR